MTEMLTPQPTLFPLPYLVDSMSYFETVHSSFPMALLLQSDPACAASRHAGIKPRGRFDIMTAAPDYWLETHLALQSWKGISPPALELGNACSFTSLHQLIEAIQSRPVDYSECHLAELPFCGGLIGYCS